MVLDSSSFGKYLETRVSFSASFPEAASSADLAFFLERVRAMPLPRLTNCTYALTGNPTLRVSESLGFLLVASLISSYLMRPFRLPKLLTTRPCSAFATINPWTVIPELSSLIRLYTVKLSFMKESFLVSSTCRPSTLNTLTLICLPVQVNFGGITFKGWSAMCSSLSEPFTKSPNFKTIYLAESPAQTLSIVPVKKAPTLIVLQSSESDCRTLGIIVRIGMPSKKLNSLTLTSASSAPTSSRLSLSSLTIDRPDCLAFFLLALARFLAESQLRSFVSSSAKSSSFV